MDGRVQYMGGMGGGGVGGVGVGVGLGDECVEPLVPFPYLYPPPLYSVPYYPIDSEPGEYM